MAMWKLQLAIWKLNMALGKLQMAIWKLKMAIRKLKNEHFEAQNVKNAKIKTDHVEAKIDHFEAKIDHFEAQNVKTGKMQVLDPKLSKMAAPNFEANSLCGPSTVFQGRWPNQGRTPQDPPKKRQFVAQAAFWS